jgi:tRNA(adenine34) deaminase
VSEAGTDDRVWMERALAQARMAATEDEVPVGAVVVCADGTVIEDHNRTRQTGDPTAHAETLALRRAASRLGDWRLEGHTLYVTLEPCAMCAGAIILSRVARLVFATPDPKAGMCGTLANLVQDPRLNHRVELTAGVCSAEASDLLKWFFSVRRDLGQGRDRADRLRPQEDEE